MSKMKESMLLEEYTAKDWAEICGPYEPEDVLNEEEYDAYLDWRQDIIDTYHEGDL